MAKYEVLYCKFGPGYGVKWEDDKGKAERFADRMRRAGYDVSIWEHTDKGATKIE